MSKIYCDTITGINQESFKDVEFYHGFNAFFRNQSFRSCFNTVLKCPEYQICTSTKWLGMMGIKVKGTVLTASNYDLFSGIDRDNDYRRYFNDRDLDNLVYDYNDLIHHEDDPEENNEIVLQHTTVTAIWITSDASNSLKDLAKELSEMHNLPLIQVGESIFA